MKDDELDAFHEEFFQDVHAEASARGLLFEDAFFDLFSRELIEEGEFDTADRVQFIQRGLRVDGYGGDPRDTDGVLAIIVMDVNNSTTRDTLTQTEMTAAFKRTYNYVLQSREKDFRLSLEETTPEFGLADTIAARWDRIDQIRLIMMSNRVLSTRVDGHADKSIDGVPVTHSVWDLSRLWERRSSGRAREDIIIDLESDYGGALPILPAHLEGADYEAYLIVFPGAQLASIYRRWRARLLEQNVRVFLQARGNVNKGIRNTIENDPEMFFAYNNGVAATAEEVDLKIEDGVAKVARFRNLQIVNGGQTTASLHEGLRKKRDLSRVFVQMKLAIVPPERTLEVVPKISEYANTQNRVNAADFFANHPFHIRMEEFSRRIFAPSPDGTFKRSKWFYERARGAYQDARAHLTTSAKSKFDIEFPKSQVFTKTDLAKFEMVWEREPHIVSKGAQKNFATYAARIGKTWEKRPEMFNEGYYTRAIARAIVFREVEKMVSAQPWYEGGYRANVVAYAIAKVSQEAHDAGVYVDFKSIWQTQEVPQPLMDALTAAAKTAHDIITSPPSANQNITEWAKQQACWERVASAHVEWPQDWAGATLSSSQQKQQEKDDQKVQKQDDGITAQKTVLSAGGPFWRGLRDWGRERAVLSPDDDGILSVCALVPDRLPTDKQCLRAVRVLWRLREEEGYVGGPEV